MYNAREAGERTAHPHYGDEFAGRGIVEDALVAAEAARAAERTAGDAVAFLFGREGRVGVPGGPVRVVGEGFDNWELGG